MKKISFLVLILFLSGCSMNRLVTKTATPFITDGQVVLYRESDLEIAEHFLANNLKTIEILLEKNPDNKDLNLAAAQGFGAYAMGFVENSERAANLYSRGVDYALNALPPDKHFTKKVTTDQLSKLLPKFTEEELPALFWTGYNWGMNTLANLDKPENLVNLAKIEMIMSRCLILDESYYFHGVDLFYGAYYGGRPKMLGGDPDKGKTFFLKNINHHPNILIGKYFYAQYFAVQTYNEKLFDSLLKEILAYDLEQNPDYRLLNAIAKKKAYQLLQNKDNYF